MAGRPDDAAGLGAGLSLPALEARLAEERLEVLGGFAVAEGEEGFPAGTRTLLLLGPLEPGFWAHLQAQPEWNESDPVDRWSRRVIGRLACALGTKAVFPFGGPPWRPFTGWARRSGRAWPSPVGLLVHDIAGLWISYRGGVLLEEEAPPATVARPCESCAGRPCLLACPVGALRLENYDVGACHAVLGSPEGQDCMISGCLVRRACPVGRGRRDPAQSAFHMKAFHPA
jgi:epoxyqueuosine reductase